LRKVLFGGSAPRTATSNSRRQPSAATLKTPWYHRFGWVKDSLASSRVCRDPIGSSTQHRCHTAKTLASRKSRFPLLIISFRTRRRRATFHLRAAEQCPALHCCRRARNASAAPICARAFRNSADVIVPLPSCHPSAAKGPWCPLCSSIGDHRAPGNAQPLLLLPERILHPAAANALSTFASVPESSDIFSSNNRDDGAFNSFADKERGGDQDIRISLGGPPQSLNCMT